ncbi:helix-turn-helix domain-containing protein [Streptomyces sp. LS1784]|uniref:helix-turn-helix domain-containing protein n=1 Tax=Streptomyces sp. LS1784 TaxID=2851533 RepID=UPI001CCC249D|nr:helix-turn-helix transcriptional regulator [Streptomyces sp. LS1784]
MDAKQTRSKAGGLPPGRLAIFVAYVADAARRAGYDIDSPRGGGKTQLAKDAGIDPSTLSRFLAGTRSIEPGSFEGLARALRVPVRELLVRGGVVSSESLPEWPNPDVRSRPITPSEAATELGITDPVNREMFLAMVNRLRRQRAAERDDADGGAAAEA